MTVQDTRAVDALAGLDLAPEQSDMPAASRRPVRRLPVHKDWPTWALVTVQVGILVGALSLWEIGARAGWIDAFFWSGGLPTNGLVQLAKTFSFRFVPLDAALVAKLHEQGGASRYYRATNMPESAYPSIQVGSTVATIAVSNLLMTRQDEDPKLTEWVTRSVINSRDRIGADVHSAQLVDLRTAIYTDPLTLHEGARRYYRSVKP